MSIHTLPHRELNEKLAQALKQIPEFEQPEWSIFTKSILDGDGPSIVETTVPKTSNSIIIN